MKEAIIIALLGALAGCGFAPLTPPDAVTEDAPDVDAPIDVRMTTDDVEVEGSISTGGGILEVATTAITDDGFEPIDPMCSTNEICVEGAITP